MRLIGAFTVLLLVIGTPTALAQEDGSVQAKVRGGSVIERAPGNWIRDALARHNEVSNDRFNGGDDDDGSGSSGGGSASTGGSTGGSSLSDLIGSLGSVSGLSGLIGSLGDSLGGGSSASAGTGGSSSTGGSQFTIEDLIRLRDTGSLRPINAASTGTEEISIGAKTTLQAQTIDDDEQKFTTRLVDSLLGSFFTALAFGVQTSQFVDLLEDGIRTLITPPVVGGDGDAGDGGDGDGDAGGTGDGIEDLDPSGGDGGDGSVVSAPPGPRLFC